VGVGRLPTRTRDYVKEQFQEKWGEPYDPDPETLAEFQRMVQHEEV